METTRTGEMFTLEELLAELEKQDTGPEGYFTTAQWAKWLNISPTKMLKLLNMAKDQGKLLVTKKPITSLDGSPRPRPVYAFRRNTE